MSSATLYQIERVLWLFFPPLAFVAWAAADVAHVIETRQQRSR